MTGIRNESSGYSLGIDASRCRSGGAIEHLKGLLSASDPRHYDIGTVHLWSYRKLLDLIPDRPWLQKHSSSHLEHGYFRQAIWQRFLLARELRKHGCSMLFTADASTFSNYYPSIVLNQDLLAFEPGIFESYGFGLDKVRLFVIRHLQLEANRSAIGSIYLTQYAKQTMSPLIGGQKTAAVIPHGFESTIAENTRPIHDQDRRANSSFKLLYVSPFSLFKNQWNVVLAVRALRDRGLDVELTLIGGGSGIGRDLLNNALAITDPAGSFIKVREQVPHHSVLEALRNADAFVFASRCEAFGIALLEAMAAGLPIAASNRSSISETLQDGGIYFDPDDPISIADSLERLIADRPLCTSLSARARELASRYSWANTANATWGFIRDSKLQISLITKS